MSALQRAGGCHLASLWINITQPHQPFVTQCGRHIFHWYCSPSRNFFLSDLKCSAWPKAGSLPAHDVVGLQLLLEGFLNVYQWCPKSLRLCYYWRQHITEVGVQVFSLWTAPKPRFLHPVLCSWFWNQLQNFTCLPSRTRTCWILIPLFNVFAISLLFMPFRVLTSMPRPTLFKPLLGLLNRTGPRTEPWGTKLRIAFLPGWHHSINQHFEYACSTCD